MPAGRTPRKLSLYGSKLKIHPACRWVLAREFSRRIMCPGKKKRNETKRITRAEMWNGICNSKVHLLWCATDRNVIFRTRIRTESIPRRTPPFCNSSRVSTGWLRRETPQSVWKFQQTAMKKYRFNSSGEIYWSRAYEKSKNYKNGRESNEWRVVSTVRNSFTRARKSLLLTLPDEFRNHKYGKHSSRDK